MEHLLLNNLSIYLYILVNPQEFVEIILHVISDYEFMEYFFVHFG